MNKNILSIFGISVTVIYGVSLYCLVQSKLPTLIDMELNNIGDFLAGAFGPLAIFWLILGFFQQGKELNQNTEALKLQALELRNSVDQQKKMLRVVKSQARTEQRKFRDEQSQDFQKAKPKFIFCGFGGKHSDTHHFSCNILNAGASITNLTISLNVKVLESSGDKYSILNNGDKIRFEFKFKSGETPKNINLKIEYDDGKDIYRIENFELLSFINNEHGYPEISLVDNKS